MKQVYHQQDRERFLNNFEPRERGPALNLVLNTVRDGAGRRVVALARSWRGDFSFELTSATHGILCLYGGVSR